VSEKPESYDNDISVERKNISEVTEDDDNPRLQAYRIAAHVMTEFEPGFVIIGSPNMGETPAGYLYPDSIGIIINNDVNLTQFGLASVLEELVIQLKTQIDDVEDYIKGQTDDSDKQ
jgi:hypothetical protein